MRHLGSACKTAQSVYNKDKIDTLVNDTLGHRKDPDPVDIEKLWFAMTGLISESAESPPPKASDDATAAPPASAPPPAPRSGSALKKPGSKPTSSSAKKVVRFTVDDRAEARRLESELKRGMLSHRPKEELSKVAARLAESYEQEMNYGREPLPDGAKGLGIATLLRCEGVILLLCLCLARACALRACASCVLVHGVHLHSYARAATSRSHMCAPSSGLDLYGG